MANMIPVYTDGKLTGYFEPEKAELLASIDTSTSEQIEEDGRSVTTNLYSCGMGVLVLLNTYWDEIIGDCFDSSATTISREDAVLWLLRNGLRPPNHLPGNPEFADLNDVFPTAVAQQSKPSVPQDKAVEDRFAELRAFARDKLKGKGRAVIEALCDADGAKAIPDLAIDRAVDWDNPFKGFDNIRAYLNPKIKKLEWILERNNNAATLRRLTPEKSLRNKDDLRSN